VGLSAGCSLAELFEGDNAGASDALIERGGAFCWLQPEIAQASAIVVQMQLNHLQRMLCKVTVLSTGPVTGLKASSPALYQ
jgi:hypothetical protein